MQRHYWQSGFQFSGQPLRLLYPLAVFSFDWVYAADRLVGLHSAQVMSQSMPWIAQEAGLFKKYDLRFSAGFHSLVAGGNRRHVERRRRDRCHGRDR